MTFTQIKDKLAAKARSYGNLTWTQGDNIYAINEGYREFCRLTHIARDQVSVTIVKDTALFSYPTSTAISSILKIWRAEWDGVKLGVKDTLWMDENLGNSWRENTGTSIQYVLTDSEDPDKIRIYPILDDDDYIGTNTLKIDVSYIPVELSAGTDTPVIPAIYHDALVYYAISWLFELPVQSKQNPGMGDRAKIEFYRLVGSAISEVNQGKINKPYKRMRANKAFM